LSAVLTAIVPVRRAHPEFLRRAIGSLLDQTRPDWRALVAVHAPERAEVEALLPADDRIELLDDHGGLAARVNLAMRHAGTEFVAQLNADDRWAPEAVAVLAEHLRARPDADFLHTGRVFVDEHDRPLSQPYLPRDDVTLAAFADHAPVKHLMCWRRELALRAGGMDESIRHHGPDDFDFPWTMAEHGAVFHAVPEPLYVFRDHRAGFRLTTHVPRTVQERELRAILRKHGVPRAQARRRIQRARRQYLFQSLYRGPLDRLVRERIGLGPRGGAREQYR
jgi:glycosyltransferase involved in cell wall biosynthesis